MTEFYAALKSLWVVWLMGVFIAIAVYAYWPSNKGRLQAHARIPLDDEPIRDLTAPDAKA